MYQKNVKFLVNNICPGYDVKLWPGYDVKLHPVNKAQFSTIEVLVAMQMTRWEIKIVPCLAGGNASVTCLKMLVMRFADVQCLCL